MENYKKSLNELQEMKNHGEVLANLTETDIQMGETLGEILESESLYLEATGSTDTLILSESVNSDIFEAVGVSVVNTLNESDEEIEDESEIEEGHEGDSEEPDSEDNGSADEENDVEQHDGEEDEDEEDTKDESEEISPEDAEELKEALVGMIPKKSYTIKTESGNGWIVNEGSEAHTTIGLSLFNKLSGLCEATEDTELLNNFLAEQKYAEKKGMGVVIENKFMGALKKGKERLVTTWKSGKLGKAKVLGAGALGAGAIGAGAYGVKKLIDKKKAKKASDASN